MSFKTNLRRNQALTAIDVNNVQLLNNYELTRSFNNESIVNKNTKLIIVGTFTPPEGRKNGYFYSAGKNGVYKLLDNYFASKNSKFVELKKDLINEKSNKTLCVKNIKNELQKFNIAFLDVIDFAIAPTQSCKDDDIKVFNLDYNSFKKKLDNMSDFNFVCTSKNAVMGLLCILEKFGISAKNDEMFPIELSYNNKKFAIDLASQQVRNSKYNNNKIKNRQLHWCNILAKYI